MLRIHGLLGNTAGVHCRVAALSSLRLCDYAGLCRCTGATF